MTKRVIVDASVVIEAVVNRLDISGQIKNDFPKSEIVTSRSVMDELKKISDGRGATARAAKVGVDIVKKNGVRIKTTEKIGDDSLLELCGEDSVLLTQDKELRRRCKTLGFTAGFIRQRKYLMLDTKSFMGNKNISYARKPAGSVV